ncbi:transmembrane signaling protein,TspO/MBR family [[Clostridium] sordellii ATCC 9714]|nr:transmembrane signaling protein,TspO/MBR family [[Clostridium] sordellii ATCC 9714] [Paeniclostridium sordellii ATCC 9714]
MIISTKDVKNFIVSVLIPLIVGFSSSYIAQLISKSDISSSYGKLIKPGFFPPPIYFL